MTSMRRGAPLVAVALVVTAVIIGLPGCGGGGGGGGDDDGDPILLAIRLLNVPLATGLETVELWNWNTGAGLPNPPGSIPLNVGIEFEFAGRVDASSLPSGGVAGGTINITAVDGAGTVTAAGSFGVSDSPNGPVGNNRIVTFLPNPPADPNNPAETAGLIGNATYTIFVPAFVGGNTQVLGVGGGLLQYSALTTFITCNPVTNPLGAAGCFTDPVQGPPHVTMTIPQSSDPAPPLINPASILDNTVTIYLSEPIFPAGVNLQNVRLVNAASGAQVPGIVQFFQLGTKEAGPSTARIDYIASSALLASATYEIEIDAAVQDFGGNSVVMYDPANPALPQTNQRFFGTLAVPFCSADDIVEDFSSTVNRDTVTGAVIWDGSGQLFSEFPFELVGNGSFGNLAFAGGPATLDTGIAGTTGYDRGRWDAIDFTVAATANVRAIGPYQIHVRCLGSATISGEINGNGGQNGLAPLGTPEQGPGNGAFNNGGNVNNAIVRGGNGNAGAGNGGRASWGVLNAANAFVTRTPIGEGGFGPALVDQAAGTPNTGPYGANELFGGGAGGDGGFRFPSGGVVGEIGGIGGAGGSSWEPGGDGQPFSVPLQGCMPTTPAVQAISMATPVPASMVFPVTLLSAGSGGGGGGDRHEVAGPMSDDQGGGGAGGGGGFRCSAIGNIDIQPGAVVRMNGANGGLGNTFFGGGGGGGSGGMIWLQSFSDVMISPQTQLQVTGGAASNTCGSHSSGPGGGGLYQFEDADGQIPTNFMGGQAGGNNVNVVQFPFGTTVTGVARSIFFDTGYGDPDYDPATVVEMFDLGANPAPGSSVTIEYQGAFEDLSGGQPNLTSLSTWVTGANLNMIDGYRYVRFRVTISYDSPNAQGTGTLPGNTLPTVDFLSFGYSIPCSLLGS